MRAPAAALVVLLTAPLSARAAELRLEAEGGWSDLSAARDAARAVFGSSSAASFGFAVSYGASRSGPFGRVGVSLVKRRGERVFAVDRASPVFRLGHPLEMKMVPLYALGGWRITRGRFSPYLGLGGGVTFYDEHSTVAELKTSTSDSHFSLRVARSRRCWAGRCSWGCT